MLQEAKEICPTTTRRLIGEGALLVVVREPHEVQALALDVLGILCIPLSEMETRWSEIPRDREVVMVCQRGESSLKATYYMQYHGYTQVSNMSGGIEKWNRKGFPVKGQMPAVGGAASGCCGSESVAGMRDVSSCCASSTVQPSDASCCGGPAAAAQQRASCC